MRIIYPDEGLPPEQQMTPDQRLDFLYKSLDNIERLHRYFGEWWQLGNIPEERWLGIPIEMRVKYPYAPQIDEATFEKFRSEDANPIISLLWEEISTIDGEKKRAAVASTEYDPDFSNIGE